MGTLKTSHFDQFSSINLRRTSQLCPAALPSALRLSTSYILNHAGLAHPLHPPASQNALRQAVLARDARLPSLSQPWHTCCPNRTWTGSCSVT
jgi:hypothetical protein